MVIKHLTCFIWLSQWRSNHGFSNPHGKMRHKPRMFANHIKWERPVNQTKLYSGEVDVHKSNTSLAQNDECWPVAG